MDFEALRTKYPGYDDAEILGAIQATKYPDYGIDEIKAAIGYKPPAAGILRTAGDVAIKGAQGIIGLGESAVGLADLATGGLAGRGLAAVGYDPRAAKEMLGRGLSQAQRESDAKVQAADGIVDTVSTAVQNPRAILGSVAESMPSILGMGAVARQMAVSIFSKAAAAAGGIETAAGQAAGKAAVEAASGKLMWASSGTEGALTAGQIAETARQNNPDDPAKMYYGVPAGIATGLIARGAGKLMGDAETSIFTGAKAAGVKGSLPVRIGKSVFSEGALEEMPQSAQEQVFTNLATDKPAMEGVGNAAGMGLLTGAAMGGGMALLQGKSEPEEQKPITEGIDKIANAGSVDEAIAAAAQIASGKSIEPTPAERIASVKASVDMEALRAKYGDDSATEFLNSLAQAQNPRVPQAVREKHLQAVEDALFQLHATRAADTALGGPSATGLVGMASPALQIGVDTTPTGAMRVGPDGVAVPEVNADLISGADRARAERDRTDGLTAQTPRGGEPSAGVMVGDGRFVTPGQAPLALAAPLPVLPGGRTQERDLGLIAAEADMARRKQAELDAIPGIAAEQDATQAVVDLAGKVKGQSALALALERLRAPKAEPVPQAPAEPRIVKRTPEMQPTSLAKAQAQAADIGGEVVRVKNQSGKFAYVALPKNAKVATQTLREQVEETRAAPANVADTPQPVASTAVSEQPASQETDLQREQRIRDTQPAQRTDADLDWMRARSRAEHQARLDAERADVEAKKEANKSLSIGERLANKRLETQIRESSTGRVMTRRQWVENRIAEGSQLRVEQEDKIKPMSRMQAFRASNEESRDHDRRVKLAGKKDTYWIGDYEVTKTEYDYARVISEAPNEPAPSPPVVAPVSGGTGLPDVPGRSGPVSPVAGNAAARDDGRTAEAVPGAAGVAVEPVGDQRDAALSDDLPTLKRQWQDAVRAGDGTLAKRINARIVEVKNQNVEAAPAPPEPPVEAPSVEPAPSGSDLQEALRTARVYKSRPAAEDAAQAAGPEYIVHGEPGSWRIKKSEAPVQQPAPAAAPEADVTPVEAKPERDPAKIELRKRESVLNKLLECLQS